MDELPADDKAVHEEDTQQQQHATGIGHHNIAGGSGYDPEEGDTNLVSQEEQGHEHEEPAEPCTPTLRAQAGCLGLDTQQTLCHESQVLPHPNRMNINKQSD